MSGIAPRGLHRFAVVLACAVVALIAAGALVKSKEAGLSVPDWPLSYGTLNPPRWWQIENVRAEHGHRLIAGTVALSTFGLAVALQRREPRRRVRQLAWGAFGTVLAQAALGGVTVLLFLPPAVSISHAALAQAFLGLVVATAVVTGPGWRRGAEAGGAAARAALRRPATALVVAIYLQILLGALVRHLGAGLAIPDFPLAFGRLVPPRFDAGIAVHFAHRLGALSVAALAAWVLARAVRRARGRRELLWPAVGVVLLVAVQILLGGAIVWSGRAVLPNTVHVAGGAALTVAGVVLALRAWQERLAPWLASARPAPAPAIEATAASR